MTDDLEEKIIDILEEDELRKLDEGEQLPKIDERIIMLLTKRMDDQRDDIKNIFEAIDEIRKSIHAPYDIITDIDNKYRSEINSLKELILAIDKKLCNPQRQKACQEQFDRDNKKKEFWEKYKSAVLLGTGGIIVLFFKEFFGIIVKTITKIFGGE